MYYLITNQDEIYNGFKINDGLDINNLGFELTDNISILKNIKNGYYLWKITIPSDDFSLNDSKNNKLIFEDRYLLSDLNTWILMKGLGVDLHYNNEAALRWASRNGHLEVVRFLIYNNADIHMDDEYALQLASRYEHLEIVKLLISHGANIHVNNECVLQSASEKGHLEIVKLLISYNADIHAYDELALLLSSKNGHLEIVRLLISYNADIHADDEYALLLASKNGHLEVVQFLIEHGADDKILKS